MSIDLSVLTSQIVRRYYIVTITRYRVLVNHQSQIDAMRNALGHCKRAITDDDMFKLVSSTNESINRLSRARAIVSHLNCYLAQRTDRSITRTFNAAR